MASPAAERALRTAIKTRVFAPVYYLHGDDDYLKEELARELVDGAVDPATRDFNLDVRRGAELDAESLGSLLSTPPMMADRRVVVVRDVGALKKEARAMLDRYLANPAADQVLVLTLPAGGKVDKAISARAEAVEFEPLSGARIPRWIVYYAEHDLGCTITPDAVALLQEAAGTELAQLRMELDKLGNFTAGGPIDETAVSAVVGVRPGETLASFLDAVGRKDTVAALALIPGLLQQPKMGAVPIVMALGTQMLALAWARAQRDRGVPAGRLPDGFYGILKESPSNMVGRPWADAVRSWTRAVDTWTARELDGVLAALLAADVSLKESRISSDEQVLANLVLAISGGRERRAA